MPGMFRLPINNIPVNTTAPSTFCYLRRSYAKTESSRQHNQLAQYAVHNGEENTIERIIVYVFMWSYCDMYFCNLDLFLRNSNAYNYMLQFPLVVGNYTNLLCKMLPQGFHYWLYVSFGVPHIVLIIPCLWFTKCMALPSRNPKLTPG